jgi:hypothetical protein
VGERWAQESATGAVAVARQDSEADGAVRREGVTQVAQGFMHQPTRPSQIKHLFSNTPTVYCLFVLVFLITFSNWFWRDLKLVKVRSLSFDSTRFLDSLKLN